MIFNRFDRPRHLDHWLHHLRLRRPPLLRGQCHPNQYFCDHIYIFILTSQVILIKTYRIISYIITYIIKVILIKMKRAGKRADAKVSSFGDEKRKAKRKAPLDLDPLFFIIHLVTFALFVITYFFAYLA